MTTTMPMSTDIFFDRLWQNYVSITPQAKAIRQMFLQTEPEVINDHVAFRTFSNSPLDLEALQPLILDLDYRVQDHYHFSGKKLRATSYIHPDSRVPKIFLSELERHKLSHNTQLILRHYCDQIAVGNLSHDIFWSGRHWSMPSLANYRALQAESEYAAWLTTMGLRANHFTVSVNYLQSTNSIEEVLRRVESIGYRINSSGGRVKGSPGHLLEQGATMADTMEITFAGGDTRRVATCFYEFARRYRNSNGELYQGFVEANANNIFDSTSGRDD